MDHLDDFSDERVLRGCAYCGGIEETKDHVPSRAFLDQPYPPYAPTVPACLECNRGFSLDEEYLACLIEVVLAGSADSDAVGRSSVRRALMHSPKLAARLDSARAFVGGRTTFAIEVDRVQRVLAKLAVGHTWYELADPQPMDAARVACRVLPEMGPHERLDFETPLPALMLPEVGSRGLQRFVATGERGWVTVQADRYRYLALPEAPEIRIAIREYLGCSVSWST